VGLEFFDWKKTKWNIENAKNAFELTVQQKMNN